MYYLAIGVGGFVLGMIVATAVIYFYTCLKDPQT